MKAIVRARTCNPNSSERVAAGTRLAAVIVLFLVIFFLQPMGRSLVAQTTTSTIEGTVTDANGAVRTLTGPAHANNEKSDALCN